jgi:hypothetical protein
MGSILTGKSMHHDIITLSHYIPDLAKDRFHVWITKYHYVPITVLGLLLLVIGDCPFCYGEFSCAQLSDCTPLS